MKHNADKRPGSPAPQGSPGGRPYEIQNVALHHYGNIIVHRDGDAEWHGRSGSSEPKQKNTFDTS